jgi:hypothetical protein
MDTTDQGPEPATLAQNKYICKKREHAELSKKESFHFCILLYINFFPLFVDDHL